MTVPDLLKQTRSEPPEQPKEPKKQLLRLNEIIPIVHNKQIVKMANHHSKNRTEEKHDLTQLNNETPEAHKQKEHNHHKP